MPEDIPKESETIAVKRAVRIAEKIKNASLNLRHSTQWWNTIAFEYLGVFFIVLLNFYTVFHLWGMPSKNDVFYSGPAIPFFAKIIEFFGVNLLVAFQYVNIVFFSLLPLTLYMFIKSITNRKIIAFMAIVVLSLPIYPFLSARLMGSFGSVDGAHISSLSIIMFSLFWLLMFLRNGGTKNLIFASITSSLVALFSPFGFMNFIIFASILTFSEILLGDGRLKIFRFLCVLFFAATLTAFWYNPSFTLWIFTGFLGEEVRYTISKLIPISLFVIPILGTFGYLLFDRKPELQTLFLASFFSICFLLISIIGGGVVPSHPGRYLSEAGISLSLLISIVIVKIFEGVPILNNNKFLSRLIFGVIIVSMLFSVPFFGKDKFKLGDEGSKVLGIWDGVSRGAIWQQRENFGGVNNVMGFIVSLGGVASLTYVTSKYRL